jgi:hypothetical protein
MGTYRPTLFSGDLPYLDQALLGRSPALDGQVRALVDQLRVATVPSQAIPLLATLAKNTEPAPHFPRLLREFVTMGSMNALQVLRNREIDILLRAWGVPPETSAEVAGRVRRLLPTRMVPDPGLVPGKLHIGNLEKRPRYLQLTKAELLARDGEQLAQVLKQVMGRAELTPTEMQKKTGISRSQVYYLTGSKSLPRKSEQLKAFLKACQLHPEQAQFVLEQWRQLDRRRGELAPLAESDVVSVDVPEGRGATAVAPRPVEELAKTIRVDGPDGRSITITGPHVEADRKQLAKLLVSATASSWRASRLVAVGSAVTLLLSVVMTSLVGHLTPSGAGELTVSVVNPLTWIAAATTVTDGQMPTILVAMTLLVTAVVTLCILVCRRACKLAADRREAYDELKPSEASSSGNRSAIRLVA